MDCLVLGFPGGTSSEDSTCQSGDSGDARDTDSVPGLGRSPAVGNDNLLQFSFMRSSMNRGAWHLFCFSYLFAFCAKHCH